MHDLLDHPLHDVIKPTPSLELEIPRPKMLTSKEELALARKARQRNPQSLPLLYSLASKLVYADHFQEAITLLESIDTADYTRFILLYNAYIGFETEPDNLKARDAAATAVNLADTPRRRATALANLAKAHIRLSQPDHAEALLRQALEANPHNKDAYKRLFRLYLNESPQKALDFANSMMDRGILHARVLGSVPMVLARMERFDEAHAAEALEDVLLQKTPEHPEGWGSLEAFNEALAAEILAHPDMRYERYGTASAKTWRVDEPSLHRSRVFPQLQTLIQREVLAYAAQLAGSNHPLARACPTHASLRNWCVVTRGEGHESWHVHQNGWISGVYYIHVQDHIAQGSGPDGCIVFGISDEIAGKETSQGYGEYLVRPHTGLMMMFPSHSAHKTYPHNGEGHRICFAFDVIPTDVISSAE